MSSTYLTVLTASMISNLKQTLAHRCMHQFSTLLIKFKIDDLSNLLVCLFVCLSACLSVFYFVHDKNNLQIKDESNISAKIYENFNLFPYKTKQRKH